jgi:hypothetical protein
VEWSGIAVGFEACHDRGPVVTAQPTGQDCGVNERPSVCEPDPSQLGFGVAGIGRGPDPVRVVGRDPARGDEPAQACVQARP